MIFMKVAYFIGSLNRGGTEMLTLDICRNHKFAPYQIMLVYRNEGDLSNEYRATGVQMIHMKPKPFGFFNYLYQLRHLMRDEHIDIVHAQTLANGVAAVFFLLGSRIRLVTTFHGFFYGIMSAIFGHIVMWGCDANLFVSNYVRNWYLSRSWCNTKKCHTIYNGVNFSKIDSAQPSLEFLKDGRIRLAMVGNFVSGRSQSIITKSIQLLKQRGITDFDMYFVGRRVAKEAWRYDDCVEYCKTKGLNNVHFLGGRGDVPSILKSIDGFVYSTDHDTFGIAVIEAMAAGLPIVVNDWPVMTEVCGKANLALYYYHSNDINDCADKIQLLLKNIHEHREKLQDACQQQVASVRNKYSIKNHIHQLEQIYVRYLR